MSRRRVTITIDPKLNIRTEAEGFIGPSCLEETMKMLRGVGKLTDIERKPDFYKKEKAGIEITT